MKFIYFYIILFLNISVSLAQAPRTFISIESPNASAIKGAIESPVTLNTGKLDISIPIHTIREKDIDLPIVLSYNTTGVKLDQHPGWVGLNWMLQAGGSVTRNIKGVPDESYLREDHLLALNGDNYYERYFPFGNFYNYSVNDNATWDSQQKITDLAKAGMQPNTFWKEAEPDEFFFNCGKYSGRFYLNEKGQFKVQGQPEVKVEATVYYDVPLFDASVPRNVNNPYTFTNYFNYGTVNGVVVSGFAWAYRGVIASFKITTPDGMIYEYGRLDGNLNSTLDEMEFTLPIFEQFAYNEVYTAWHLTKITSPSGEVITLEYERGGPIIQPGLSYSYYKGGGTAPAKGFLGWLFGGPSAYTSSSGWEWNGNFIRSTYLKKIISRSTVIEFSTSPTTELKFNYDALALEVFKRSSSYTPSYFSVLHGRLMVGDMIPSSPGQIQGSFKLGPGEYRINRQDGLSEYLYLDYMEWRKLDAIKIRSKADNKLINEWKLNYNNNPNERLTLLSVVENGNNNKPLPPYTFTYDVSYPIPGYNTMLIDHWGYLNNWFANPNPNVESTLLNYKRDRGSLSVYTKVGSLTEISYPTGGSKKFSFGINTYWKSINRDPLTGAFSVEVHPYNQSGAGLRINQIKEKAADGTEMITDFEYSWGQLLGDVQYYWPLYKGRLLNGNDYTSTRFVSESLLPLSENSAGGIIVYDTVKVKRSGNGRTEYFYRGFTESPDLTGISIDAQKTPYSPFTSKHFERGLLKEVKYFNEGNVMVARDEYQYSVNPAFANEHIRAVASRGLTLFDGNQINVIEGTAYKHWLYPYQNVQVTKHIRDEVSGNFISTTQSFEYDTDPAADNDNQLKAVTSINSKGESITTKYKHPLDFKTVQPYSEMVARRMLVPVVEESVLKNTTTFLSSVKTNFNFWNNGWTSTPQTLILPQTLEKKSLSYPAYISDRFHSYDNIGNLTSASKEGDVRNSYVWSIDQTVPIAEVTNAAATDIFHTSFEDNDGNSILGDAKTGLKSRINGYSKVVNGLKNGQYKLSYWKKNTSALWELQNQLVNVAAGVYTIELTGQIDEIRFHPSSAHMATYTYEPLIGIITKCDINDRITYYEYDGMNRLVLVRDHDRNILKKICYNYAGQPEDCGVFFNKGKTVVYRKNDCTVNTGTNVPYTIPANKYVSEISQADADAQEQLELDQHGQSNANQNGTCEFQGIFYSERVYGNFYSTSCPSPDEPAAYYVDLPARQVTSTVSQADANQNAWLQAQSLADTYGTCRDMVTLSVNGYSLIQPIKIFVHNRVTSVTYEFDVYGSQMGVLGVVPAGNYNVSVQSLPSTIQLIVCDQLGDAPFINDVWISDYCSVISFIPF